MFFGVRQFVFSGLGLFMLTLAVAQEQAPLHESTLPEPLTLEYALSVAQGQHPTLQRMDATIQKALAGKQTVEANDNIELSLQGQLRWIEPSEKAADQSNDDHRLGVIASKRLYDFGRQSARLSAADHNINSQRLRYQKAMQEHRIEVMRRFFDVLLADLKFYRYNEEMAVAYIQWDRKKERRRLNQAIDVDVLKLETEYQKIRRLRFHSEAMQRQTRARLAAVLNHPGQLPLTLAQPDLKILQQKLPEVELLQQQALKNNLGLRVLRQKFQASQQHLNAARNAYAPDLKGKMEAHSYSREIGSSDAWRAGITLNVPLYSGGRSNAVVAQAKADEYQLQAKLKEQEYNVAQAVLETWLKIDTLRIQREEMQTLASYQEIALDQSRALYELEIKADLGKAMVRVSEAEYQVKQTDFEMAIAWESLKLLTGQHNAEALIEKVSTQRDNYE